ncbi:hypothetical protein FHS21_003630 [Phyllobacterium trifolii]|uniref:Uncharacterized protein n=1 Tax=Phyllobacterium trifolii TaxID=300193 RepID=A0A839UB99_9HYPH|nr:hypothetical protein [Phyllobacterium trifolii]
MKSLLASWPLWALLAAGFAALTAIFAKVGVDAAKEVWSCSTAGARSRRLVVSISAVDAEIAAAKYRRNYSWHRVMCAEGRSREEACPQKSSVTNGLASLRGGQ